MNRVVDRHIVVTDLRKEERIIISHMVMVIESMSVTIQSNRLFPLLCEGYDDVDEIWRRCVVTTRCALENA